MIPLFLLNARKIFSECRLGSLEGNLCGHHAFGVKDIASRRPAVIDLMSASDSSLCGQENGVLDGRIGQLLTEILVTEVICS